MRTVLTYTDTMQADIKLKNIENKVGKRDFVVSTDYPDYMGGEENYPTPWSLFLAALTACQGMNVHEYCSSNGISLKGISLSLDLNYAEVAPGEKPREVGSFDVQIDVPADFPEEHIEGVKNAARHCKIVQHILDWNPVFNYEVVKN